MLNPAGGADEEFAVFLWLAVTMGVRRGELEALCWWDIELERSLMRLGATSAARHRPPHHLGKLKLAGLMRSRKEGKRQIYLLASLEVFELVRLAVAYHQPQRPQTRADSA